MIDLKIDPDTGDLAMADGDLLTVENAAAVRQSAEIALELSVGEWLFDLRDGLDRQRVFGKGVNPIVRNAEYRRAILAIPGVVEIVSLEVDFDPATRTVTPTFVARTEFDDLVEDSPTVDPSENQKFPPLPDGYYFDGDRTTVPNGYWVDGVNTGDPSPEDGQYIDGVKVADVNFYVDGNGQTVVIPDHRTSTASISSKLIVVPILDQFDASIPAKQTSHDTTFGALITP